MGESTLTPAKSSSSSLAAASTSSSLASPSHRWKLCSLSSSVISSGLSGGEDCRRSVPRTCWISCSMLLLERPLSAAEAAATPEEEQRDMEEGGDGYNS